MIKAIIYKEWLKTRVAAVVCLVATIALALYAIMGMNRVATLKGVDHIWLIMLMKDQVFVDVMRFLPLAVGLVLGAAQMYPEITQKRLKLTLHLPMAQNSIVTYMLLTGICEYLIINIVGVAMIAAYDASFLPTALTWRVVLTMVPWVLAGLCGYIFMSSVILEPSRSGRVLLALLGLVMLTIFYLQPVPEAYNGILWLLAIAIVMLTTLVNRSIYRFKEGIQ